MIQIIETDSVCFSIKVPDLLIYFILWLLIGNFFPLFSHADSFHFRHAGGKSRTQINMVWATCALERNRTINDIGALSKFPVTCSMVLLADADRCTPIRCIRNKNPAVKCPIAIFRDNSKNYKKWLPGLFGWGCSREFPFYLLEPVFLEFDIHLHVFYRSWYLIINPDFWIIEIIGSLEDLHETLVYIDAFT